MSAGMQRKRRELSGRYGCRGCSRESTCVSVGASVGFAWDSACQRPSLAEPHMKCHLCLQCQDLFQYYISAAYHLLWFIKGMIKGHWCQGPDGLSVLDCVLGLYYHTSMLQPCEPQTARCSRWGMVVGCPNPRAGAAALQGQCKGGALLPSDRSFPSRGTSAAAGALQLIPVPACSHAVSVSQVLQLLRGRKVLLLPLGPYLELFWCFISTRCLSPRCLSQRQTNSSPPGALPVT